MEIICSTQPETKYKENKCREKHAKEELLENGTIKIYMSGKWKRT